MSNYAKNIHIFSNNLQFSTVLKSINTQKNKTKNITHIKGLFTPSQRFLLKEKSVLCPFGVSLTITTMR